MDEQRDAAAVRIFPSGVPLITILPEEAYLERRFGDTYLSHKNRVRRWI